MEKGFIDPNDLRSKFRSKSDLWTRMSVDRKQNHLHYQHSWHIPSLILKMLHWVYEADFVWWEKVCCLLMSFMLCFDLLFRHIKNRQVIYFKIPNYHELGVKDVWPLIENNHDLIIYFPISNQASSQKGSSCTECWIHWSQTRLENW